MSTNEQTSTPERNGCPHMSSSICMEWKHTWYCWECIKHVMPNISIHCSICSSFILDWLLVPLKDDDIFHTIQIERNIKKVAPWFAKELSLWVHRLQGFDDAFIQTHIQNNEKELLHVDEQSNSFPELFHATAMLRTMFKSPYKEDITYWIDILTDLHIMIDNDDTPMWVGFWAWKVFTSVPTIHAEHTGVKAPSYAGPALGMTPLPMASTPSESYVYHPPLTQEQQLSSWVLQEEEGELFEQGLSVLEGVEESIV